MRYFHLFRNLSNWYLYLAVKFSLTDADPLLFRTRNNILVEVPRRLLHEFKEIFMEECYVSGLAIDVPDNPTIIDIGANAGFFSLFAASRFPNAKILSFEPIESNFRQLQRNRDLNEIYRISCFPKAVSGHNGKIALSFSPADPFTTSATVFGESSEEEVTIQVPCVTLQRIFEENGVQACDLMKMDCEGAEYSILYSCSADCLRRISQMVIEVHSGAGSNENIQALGEYVKSYGFSAKIAGHMLWAWRP